MFKFFKKKVIEAQALLDLRYYPPEALKGIKEISAVGTVIIPENPSAEYMKAYSEIHKDAVGLELYLPLEKKIVVYDGAQQIYKLKLPEDTIAFFNGMFLICGAENNPDCFMNGITVVNRKAEMNVLSSGLFFEVDFDEDRVKYFSGSTNVDADFIRNLEENTFIFCGNCLKIEADVTEKDIIEKNLKFFAGNSIACSKSVAGCVRSRASVGNKTVIY